MLEILSNDGIDDMKHKKRNEITQYAYLNVEAYSELLKKYSIEGERIVFEKLPIINKDFFCQIKISILSKEYIELYLKDKLIWSRTSGTSGVFTNIFWDEASEKKSLFYLWVYRRKYYNIFPNDKMCCFFSWEYDSLDIIQDDKQLRIPKKYLYNGKLEEIYQKIQEFNPKWMILQPSIARLLVDYVSKYGKIENLKYIELTGEYLQDSVRAEIEDKFQCITANQYGSREVNSIAFECPFHALHCLEGNVYVEVINMDNEGFGDIVITSLKNKAMPVIRYQLGDKVKIHEKNKCKCGKCGRVIELKEGRSDNWIYLSDGSKIHVYILIQGFHFIQLETEECIKQYQIRQRKVNCLEIGMVVNNKGEEEIISKMLAEWIANKIDCKIEIKVTFYEYLLPDEKTGKLVNFIGLNSKNKEET